MKKVLIALLVLGAFGTSVFAGEWKKEGSVLLGYAMPSGDVGDLLDSGVSFGLDYDGYKINDMWSIGAGFFYTSNTKENTTLGMNYDYTLASYGLSPYAKYSKDVDMGGKKVNVYGLAGLGMYGVSQELEFTGANTIYNTDASESEFGFNLGGGVMYPLNDKMQLGLDLRYHIVASDLSYFIPAAKFTYSF